MISLQRILTQCKIFAFKVRVLESAGHRLLVMEVLKTQIPYDRLPGRPSIHHDFRHVHASIFNRLNKLSQCRIRGSFTEAEDRVGLHVGVFVDRDALLYLWPDEATR